MMTRAMAAAVWAGACGLCVAAEGVTLVKDGVSQRGILLDERAGPSERWAAEELAACLKQMSGAEVRIVAGGGLTAAPAVVLGFGEAAEALGVKADPSLGREGFLIKTVGANLVIAGGRERGTMYGVFTLLERLGCRWWTPTETTIPQRKTVEVPAMDLRVVPALEYRDMMYPEIFPRGDPNSPDRKGQVWAARNRVNGMAWDPAPERIGGWYRVSGNLVHSYGTLLKASGVEVTEDMWALRDGKRMVNRQPCLSDGRVLEAMTRAVLARLKAEPDLEFVVVGQDDNNNFCTCPQCAAVDAAEESHAGQVIAFANRVAEAVEKQVPGAKIVTAAYHWSRKPPKTLRPRANVYITLCSIECDFAHPLAAASNPENKAFKEDIEGWAPIAPKLLIWHYCGNRVHYLMPNPDLESFAPNVRFFRDNKVRGIFVQGTHVGRMTEMVPLRMWLWSRVLWDPNADGNALIDEFCQGYYGPAARAVRQYIDIMHQTGRKEEFHLGRRAYLDAPFLRPEVIAEAAAALREAEAQVTLPEYTGPQLELDLQRRVRHAKMPITYVLFKRGPMSKTWAAVQAKLGKLGPVALAAEFAQTVRENDINYTADPEDVKPWVNWMQEYARRIVQTGGKVLPPELAEAEAAKVRVIQACQMDGRSRWWKPAEGASDGWALACPAGAYGNSVRLSPYEDYSPGKTYKVFARVRCPRPTGAGVAFSIEGPNRADPQWFRSRLTVPADKVKPDQWQVYECTTRKFIAGDNLSVVCGPALPEVEVDCFWLVETAGE